MAGVSGVGIGLKLKIKVEGKTHTIRSLDAVWSKTLRAAEDITERKAKRLRSALRAAAPKSSGATANSIYAEQLGKATWAVDARSRSAEFLEFGTRPHPLALSQRRRHMPPRGALLGWMGRKGIPATAEILIRRRIQFRGTKPQPFWFRTAKPIVGSYVRDVVNMIRRNERGFLFGA